jgi:hypothetical protein
LTQRLLLVNVQVRLEVRMSLLVFNGPPYVTSRNEKHPPPPILHRLPNPPKSLNPLKHRQLQHLEGKSALLQQRKKQKNNHSPLCL